MNAELFAIGFLVGYSLILTSFFYLYRHRLVEPEDESEL